MPLLLHVVHFRQLQGSFCWAYESKSITFIVSAYQIGTQSIVCYWNSFSSLLSSSDFYGHPLILSFLLEKRRSPAKLLSTSILPRTCVSCAPHHCQISPAFCFLLSSVTIASLSLSLFLKSEWSSISFWGVNFYFHFPSELLWVLVPNSALRNSRQWSSGQEEKTLSGRGTTLCRGIEIIELMEQQGNCNLFCIAQCRCIRAEGYSRRRGWGCR